MNNIISTSHALNAPTVIDQLKRSLKELRISVTDRCNFRCRYCMPKEIFKEHHSFLNADHYLTFEEITRLVHIFIPLGVEKIRITGGEPLLRKNLPLLIETLSKIQTQFHQPIELALTTNGILLSRYANALKKAGLNRLNISLDSLDVARFQQITDSSFTPKDVLNGIQAAQEAGFEPHQLKINTVLQRHNFEDIFPLAEYCRNHQLTLRFIEFMDVGSSNQWQQQHVITEQEILFQLKQHYSLIPITASHLSETAKRWRYNDNKGEVGIISSISNPFCQFCTRARLSADGKLFLCLFAEQGYNLKDLCEKHPDNSSIKNIIAHIWQQRQDQYSATRQFSTHSPAQKIEMFYIGG